MVFRFEQEQKTLKRAVERPWFGWGGYCRACLFEPWSGNVESVRDGGWIIQLGEFGIAGFIAKFSLLLFPVVALMRRVKYVPRNSDRHLLAALGLMVGLAAFDLIPNSDYNRLVFVLSGALWGCLTGILWQAAALREQRRLARNEAKKATERTAVATSVGAALLCASLLATPAAAATPDAVGGGFADAGIEGAYYANPDFEGMPAFTRRDVRIDFDWGEVRPIGGSTAEPYRSFPRDGFSVRWSGRIIPRFSEAYTFQGKADDHVRIRVRAAGQSRWKTVVDRWNDVGAFESKPFKMRANELYDIQVEYREVSGAAQCTLMWKSKSTPPEVIDPIRQQGIIWPGYHWANLMKSASYMEGTEEIDARGWPTASGVELVATEQRSEDPDMSGTYLLRFEGKAQVRQECCVNPVFVAGGRRFERKLPKGVGYDDATNTTTSVVEVDGSRMILFFDDTQRGPGHRGDGISRIQLMLPIAQGSTQHHAPDEIVYRPFKRVLKDHFTLLRIAPGPNNPGRDWSQRTLPGDAFFLGNTQQENWEYLVMLANEVGLDLYVSIPIGADDEYLEKFALLMRYGSDGREPYRGPTADPVYPPLNPNLRIYVEWDNEIWNWAFGTTHVAVRLTKAEHDKGSPIWKSVDYDGQAGNPEHLPAVRRWHAVRTVQASKVFRRIWGDDAMGSRVRMLLEYQYDNDQNTAFLSLDFLDGYYNNRSAKNVSDPHPVNYYLWGAGGAAYYGLRNGSGQQTHTLLRDASFEKTSVEPGTLRFRPRGTPWTFTGRAGLIRPQGKKEINGLRNLPTPSSGKQAAVLLEGGSISQKVRFAKPGTYAVAFQGAGSGKTWPGYHEFEILVDGRAVSPRNQDDYRASDDGAQIGGFARDINSLDEEWGSAVFRIDEPGLHTISFVARDPSPDYLLIDEVRIASADAITTSGFHRGEALGDGGEPDFAHRLMSQAKYARAFGLQVVAYEAGWSVGGDHHQMPIQTWCKFEDPRATGVNDRAIDLWDRSGSFLPVWGVYKYWPAYDYAGANDYSIMRSFRAATQRPRTEPTSGRRLPATLRLDDTDWSHTSEGTGWRRHVPFLNEPKDQWHAWMLIAPATGTYTLRVEGRGGGRLIVEVDGEAIAELSSLEASGRAPLSTKLTKGAHAIRVVMVGSDLELDRIVVSAPQAGR
jgi:hypothetical protein